MKKYLVYLVVALLIATGLNACYYDEVASFEGLPTNVSLKNDVQPIFNRDCNMSGCHDAIPSHDPGLTPEIAYDELISGGYVNTIDPANSILYLSVNGGGMPSGRAPLSENDKKIILAWITEGAKNN
ncbi:MAG TPA: cytochrome c [Cyclobacteriaceae bacterium]|nr:cytochrome c [Cyclobacteriaceae bacterium]